MSRLPVVIYGYERSPFTNKIIHILNLKGIPYNFCNVPRILPRPQIADLLGIPYRKIPVLAIGNDVYCDTSIISFALEYRFPTAQGFETIFPPKMGATQSENNCNDIGLQKTFATLYTDRSLFLAAVTTLPWDMLPEEFIKDRSGFMGFKLDTKERMAQQPAGWSTLSSHLVLIEQQLSDGREYYLGTVSPSLADIGIFFNFDWIKMNKNMDKVFDSNNHPFFAKWMGRMATYLQQRKDKNSFKTIDSDEAAKLITSSIVSDDEIEHVGFDSTQAEFLGVKQGSTVSVAPEDTGASHPTVGKLIGLSKEEVVLEVKGTAGNVKVHFPRLAFSIRSDSPPLPEMVEKLSI